MSRLVEPRRKSQPDAVADELLAEFRDIINDEETYFDRRNEAISAMATLDAHLSTGGELPKAWARNG